MKKIKTETASFWILPFFLITTSVVVAGNGKNWSVKMEPGSFIENKGQFHLSSDNATAPSNVLYAVDDGSTMIYFTKTGITYSFLTRFKKEEDVKGEREEEEQMSFKTDAVSMTWEGANANTVLIAEEAAPDYYSYTIKGNTGKNENINKIIGYKKLIYKNVYPNIDIEYVFHSEGGLKYSLILHPGADVSKIKMHYSNAPSINSRGEVLIPTDFGDIIDHAPLSFYSDRTASVINSSYKKSGKNILFELAAHDPSQSITIDPWIQTPALANSHGVWECENDAAGNVYMIGGDMPMKLLKYNSAGGLLWTYATPWDTSSNWLGTLATDKVGNSYITSGSTAALQKIDSAGNMIYNVTGTSYDEYWSIAFSVDQTNLFVGGTRLFTSPFTGSRGVIFNINAATGIVTKIDSVGHTDGGVPGPALNIEEVRSVTSSYNEQCYFMTLDSIGSINEDPATYLSSDLSSINDGYALGYKSENYRPNNGNAGMKTIRANGNYLYTQNGATVQKRSLVTGAVITAVTIPGGSYVSSGFGRFQAGNSGLDIDSCGNVYVGSGNAVIKYDSNLIFIDSVMTAYHVYDIAVGYNGNIVACGATGNNSISSRTGYLQQVDLSACDPMPNYFHAVTTGIAANDVSSILAYPNPANESITISSGKTSIIQIRMFDEKGVLVIEKNNLHLTEIQLNTTELATGLYFISIRTEAGAFTKKINIIK